MTLLSLLFLSPTAAMAQSDTLKNSFSRELDLHEAVVVTGARTATDVRHLPQTVSVVGRNALTAHERTSVLPTLMEQVPGLMVTGRGMMGYGVSTGGTGGMMLRGISSTAGQVMVLIDGHPQYNGIYGHSIADAYQTMMTERVEVLRGPASMLYGSNAMGGVVNIVTRNANQSGEGTRTQLNVGAGSYGSVQAEGSNQTRHGAFTSTVAAHYSRTDNHRPNMGFDQYGGYARLGYELSSTWRVYADADVTHFNASYPGTLDSPMLEADQDITRGAVAIGAENSYQFGSNRTTNGRVSFYDNFGRHRINDGYSANGGTPQARLFRSTDALMGVSAYQTAQLWAGGRITLGVDYQNIFGHAYYTSRATGEVLDTPNKQSGRERNHEIAGYVDWRQDVARWLTLDAGVRYDHHSVTHGEWVPQVGLVYRPMDRAEIKAMASKGFRCPTMREMYLYPPSNTYLLPERLWSYELAWHHRPTADARVAYGLNAFYIKADNIIQAVNKKNVNTGKLHNAGIEADVTWQVNGHWQLSSNHSWLHMKQPVISAPRYKGNLSADMHYGQWTAHASLTHVAGMTTRLATPSTSELREQFTLLNVTFGYQPLSFLRFWLRGENLLAQHYEFVEGMPMPKATVMGGLCMEF